MFLTLWDSLLMTFRAQPSDNHIYSTFQSCVKDVAGLRIVIDYLDRIDYEHVEKTYSYLMGAATAWSIDAAPNSRRWGGSKGDKGDGKEPRRDMVCFHIRDKDTCDNGKACAYSHDPQNIKAAKAELAVKGKDTKGGGKGAKGGGKGKICGFFLNSTCEKGYKCDRLHTPFASPATATAPTAPTGVETPTQPSAGPGQQLAASSSGLPAGRAADILDVGSGLAGVEHLRDVPI
eukprot:8197908-Heterocapsa_arctica.AAC.1